MSLFVDPMSSSLTTEVVESEVKSGALRGKQTRRGGGALKVKIDRAADDDGLDREKQFLIFQMGKTEDQPSMFEVSEVRPEVDGSENEPDVLVHLEMQSFNLAKSEAFDKDTAATIRLNFGKDENSRDRYFDTAFWSIAAGLKLYNEAKNQKSAGSDLKSDFRKALANRPIEIPGGLGKLTFEVVKHEPPPWWKKIFTFLKSGAGTALTSTLGFPAVTGTAVNLLDQFLGRLTESKPDVLFKSIPMRLALSKLAADDYTGGNQRIRVDPMGVIEGEHAMAGRI